jgi:hypothetical protein
VQYHYILQKWKKFENPKINILWRMNWQCATKTYKYSVAHGKVVRHKIWRQILWRTISGAPQKSKILWRTEQRAPQNSKLLWRTRCCATEF